MSRSPVTISVSHQLHNLIDWSDEMAADQLPWATALAIAETAVTVGGELQGLMARVFDRPTRFVLHGFRTNPVGAARSIAVKIKKSPNPEVSIVDKDFAAVGVTPTKVIWANIVGGQRSRKRFENALQYALALPAGKFVVPGPAARLDAHGNWSGAQITEVLSALRAQAGGIGNAKLYGQTARGAKYFVIGKKPGQAAGADAVGIGYRAPGQSKTEIVALYVRPPQYRAILDWFGEANRTVDRVFVSNFQRAMAEAIDEATRKGWSARRR